MNKKYVFAALLAMRLFVALFLVCNETTAEIPANGQPSLSSSVRQEAATPVITYSM